MRVELIKVPFTNAGTGATLADLDLSGYEYVSIGVSVSGFTGAPAAGTHFSAVPADGAVEFIAGDVIGTGDVLAAGNVMLSRIGLESAAKTQILSEGFMLPASLSRVHVKTVLVTATAVSGTVYVWGVPR